MKKNKRIILSYDYELFFGERSGTVLKSIIEPTNKLIEVMEQIGFRGNFFVDYLMFRELEKVKEERAQADLALLKEQIRNMVRRGHRVELHLHPHWIDAKYNGDGTWNFDDFTHYSLSSLDEETIVSMFKEGTEYLNGLCREIEPDYKIVAFRAGGWAVQPFDKLKKGFEASGIKIDSSTSLGAYSTKENQGYDFRVMPEKEIYRFSDDVCKEDEKGQFVEVPISSVHLPIILYLRDVAYLRKGTDLFNTMADGTHVRRNDYNNRSKGNVFERIAKLCRSDFKIMLNCSALSILSLWYMKKAMRKNQILCFIDHPKDYCEASKCGIDYLEKHYMSINYCDLIKR